jgi:hypothetical protein
MTWPLLPLAVRVERRGWPAIWLPLILFWPLILALFALALPLCVLLQPRPIFAALVATYNMLCALHGTNVEVADSEHSAWSFSLY